MIKRLCLSTGLVLALASPTFGQSSSTQPADLLKPQDTQTQGSQTQRSQTQGTQSQDNLGAAPTESQGATDKVDQGQTGHDKAGQGQPQTAKGEVLTEQKETELRASSILGMQVANAIGQDLGNVEDIVFDSKGQVTGLVISTGGILGIGARPVGVAWTDLSLAKDQEALVIDLTEEQLAAAPEFKTNEDKAREQQMQQELQQRNQQQPAGQTNAPATGLGAQPKPPSDGSVQ